MSSKAGSMIAWSRGKSVRHVKPIELAGNGRHTWKRTPSGAIVLLTVSILGRNGVDISPEEASALTVIVSQLAVLAAGWKAGDL